MVVSDRYMDCIAGLIPASSNNTAELRAAPRGGTGRNFASAKLLLVHAAWVLNPLAGIKQGANRGLAFPDGFDIKMMFFRKGG
jgi:hypothetical protein